MLICEVVSGNCRQAESTLLGSDTAIPRDCKAAASCVREMVESEDLALGRGAEGARDLVSVRWEVV